MRNDLLQSMDEVKRTGKKKQNHSRNVIFFYGFNLFTGDEMAVLSKEFADDPCSKPKRQQMIIAARALLTSVTHLLILADLVDVQLILKSIRLVCLNYFFLYKIILFFCIEKVEDDLQHIHDASNQEELIHFYKQYGKDIVDLSQHAQRRQQVKFFLSKKKNRKFDFCFFVYSRI
jgi:hypothetical protein